MKKTSRSFWIPPALLLLAAVGSGWEWQNVDVDKAASGGLKLLKAATNLSDKDEIKLGRDVAAALAARYGLVEDAARLKYLNLVGQAVVKHSSRATLPYHFGILKSQEFNAFATPGGYVFVTDGLLKGLKDEAELAGVLAHEISHVTERHIVKAIREAHVLGAGKDLAAAVGHDPDAYGKLSDFSLNLLDKGHSRKDELDADRRAIELAALVGYDPRGLRDSVERLASVREKDPAFSHFTNTHPAPAERLKTIDQALKKEKPAKDAARLADRYARAVN